MGSVRLRPPAPEDDSFLLFLRRPEIAGEFNWFEDASGEPPPAGRPAVSRLIVTLDDETRLGGVSWFAVTYGPNRRSAAWIIGITLLPEHRGRGYGMAAQRMLAEHLFATTDANRVEASTDVDNVIEQRALARAGFQREGVLRGAQYRGGRWHDLVLYACVRDSGSV